MNLLLPTQPLFSVFSFADVFHFSPNFSFSPPFYMCVLLLLVGVWLVGWFNFVIGGSSVSDPLQTYCVACSLFQIAND